MPTEAEMAKAETVGTEMVNGTIGTYAVLTRQCVGVTMSKRHLMPNEMSMAGSAALMEDSGSAPGRASRFIFLSHSFC